MTSTSAPLLGDLIARAHHTAICVDDFDAARDFYVDILGFAVEGEMDHRGEPNLGRVVGLPGAVVRWGMLVRSEEHTSELQSIMRISYDVFCLKKKKPHPQPS